MADTTKTAKAAQAKRLAKGRDRLTNILNKTGGAGEKAAAAGGAKAPRPSLNEQIEELLKNRNLQRAYRVLSKTPIDGDGKVADTPFTVAGVKRLVEMLKGRADQDGATGAKAASSFLKLMAAGKDAKDSVEGLSVAKLQRLAKLAERSGKL